MLAVRGAILAAPLQLVYMINMLMVNRETDRPGAVQGRPGVSEAFRLAASLEVGNSHLTVQAIWPRNANHWRAVTRPGWDAQVVIPLPGILIARPSSADSWLEGRHAYGPQRALGAVIAWLLCATVNSARRAQMGSRQQRIVEGYQPLVHVG